MANAMVMLTSHWSGFDNPAGLAGITSPSAGIIYRNYFGIPELGMRAAACAVPTKSGNYSLSFMSGGYELLRQSQLSLCYGMAIGKRIRAGIGLHYLIIRQPAAYGNLFAVTPSLGVQFIPSRGMTMGIHVFNPVRQQYIPSGYYQVPAGIQAGFGYQLGEEVLFCLEIIKSPEEPFVYNSGFEILLLQKVPVRFGISFDESTEFSFGIGFQHRKLKIDIAAIRHPVLGLSTALGLACSI
jgi:hypothetical protein